MEYQHQYKIIKRRTVLKWFIVIALFGFLIIFLTQDYMTDYLAQQQRLAKQDAVAAALNSLNTLRWVIYSLAGFALLTGAYITRYGYRSLKSGYFPALGSWMIEGRTVYTGDKARKLGIFQMGTGLFLMLIGISLLLYFHYVLDKYDLAGKTGF